MQIVLETGHRQAAICNRCPPARQAAGLLRSLASWGRTTPCDGSAERAALRGGTVGRRRWSCCGAAGRRATSRATTRTMRSCCAGWPRTGRAWCCCTRTCACSGRCCGCAPAPPLAHRPARSSRAGGVLHRPIPILQSARGSRSHQAEARPPRRATTVQGGQLSRAHGWIRVGCADTAAIHAATAAGGGARRAGTATRRSVSCSRRAGQVHMAAGDPAALIEACVRLGDASRGGDAHLWTEVLEYLGSQDRDCSAQARRLPCAGCIPGMRPTLAGARALVSVQAQRPARVLAGSWASARRLGKVRGAWTLFTQHY